MSSDQKHDGLEDFGNELEAVGHGRPMIRLIRAIQELTAAVQGTNEIRAQIADVLVHIENGIDVRNKLPEVD